jgi:exopolyphosphatase/guanosine-5'-triphosphate,3'-diphosphate pyrophosphatase
MARLGDGLSRTGRLGEEAMRRTIETLRHCREITGVERFDRVLPIATSPLREAKNGHAFLERVKRETGFTFRVLTGMDEALFSFLGAAEALDLSSSIFFDLGGGSLEIASSRHSNLVKVLSLPIGVLRLTQHYADSRGKYSKKDMEEMGEEVLKHLPTRRALEAVEGATLAGVGGTVRALARYDQELSRYPLCKVHNYVLKKAAVESMIEKLQGLTASEVARIEPIGGGRAETIVAGALVISSLMEKLSIDDLHASTHGLRDGVLSAFLDNPYMYLKGSMSESYVARSAKLPDPASFLRYSRPLLEAFTGAGLLSEGQVPALAHAVKLAMAENSSLDPPTLFYASMYEDSPLSHSCQLMASIALVRTRRPRTADWLLARYRSLLDPEDRTAIKGLATCATLMELLETTRTNVSPTRREEGLTLVVAPASRGFPRRLLEEAVISLETCYDLKVAIRVKMEAPGKGRVRPARGPIQGREI